MEKFEVGKMVRFKVQAWNESHVEEFIRFVRSGQFDSGIFKIETIVIREDIGGMGHNQHLTISNSTKRLISKNGQAIQWSGWWFEKVINDVPIQKAMDVRIGALI